MRVLKFLVNDQIIEPDPSCDFTGLVPGTRLYLRAEFSFSPEWDGYAKVVGFTSALGREYTPQTLTDGRTCTIPSEALERRVFKVQVFGTKDGVHLKTNKVEINQNGGKDA